MGATKKPTCGKSAFLVEILFLHRFESRIQATLEACGFILVNQALIGSAVYHRHCQLERFDGTLLLPGNNRLHDVFHMRAHVAAAGRIVLAMFLRLTCTFAGLC